MSDIVYDYDQHLGWMKHPDTKARGRMAAKKTTCDSCRYAIKSEVALICHRFPPFPVVIENKPMTMRVSVQPIDPACGEYVKR